MQSSRASDVMYRVVFWVLLVLLVGGTDTVRPAAPAQTNAPPGETRVRVGPRAMREIAVEPVEVRPLIEELTLPGKIQYSENGFSKVSSPLVGLVRAVHVRLGDHVGAGHVLLTVESADIGVAYSEFAKAESDLQFAQRNFNLSKDLYEVQAIPKKEFVQAQNDYLKAQAEYRRARERLLSLRVPATELDKPVPERQVTGRFDLKAPISGVVVERNVTVGQLVGADPAQVLYTIADLDVLQAVAEVYERDLRALSIGQPVSVSVESFPGQRFSGTVVYVGELVDPIVRTLKVRCNVTNVERKLKPEMFARVHVQVGANSLALALPRGAVVMNGEESLVFVERTAGEFERRGVATGVTSGELIEIRQGLQAGERVVVKGTLLLKGAWDKALAQPALSERAAPGNNKLEGD